MRGAYIRLSLLQLQRLSKKTQCIFVKYISSEHCNLIGTKTSTRVTPNGVILANQVSCQGP